MPHWRILTIKLDEYVLDHPQFLLYSPAPKTLYKVTDSSPWRGLMHTRFQLPVAFIRILFAVSRTFNTHIPS